MSTPQQEPGPQPIVNTGEAEHIIVGFGRTMDSLLATIAQETEQVRAGHLRAAAELEPVKAELARQYAAAAERIRQSSGFIGGALPDAMKDLRRRHELFQTALATNLTVLATAHAVSEGIIRGVSGELARKRAPTTYGSTGRANALESRASQPLALSRKL